MITWAIEIGPFAVCLSLIMATIWEHFSDRLPTPDKYFTNYICISLIIHSQITFHQLHIMTVSHYLNIQYPIHALIVYFTNYIYFIKYK